MPISRRLSEKTYRRMRRRYVQQAERKQIVIDRHAQGTAWHKRAVLERSTYLVRIAEIDEILATFE